MSCVNIDRRWLWATLSWTALASGPWYSAPAGLRSARLGPGVSILPGGRVIAPLGEQHPTGARPTAVAISASGKTLVTMNRDERRPSLTILDHGPAWEVRQVLSDTFTPDEAPNEQAWQSVAGGLAFFGERSVFVSEGNTGHVARIDLATGERRRTFDLNSNGDHASFTGDLAIDGSRGFLYVADLANFRVAAIDIRSRRIVASVPVGGVPLALALAPDARRLYVAMGHSLVRQPKPDSPDRPPSGSVGVVDVTEPAAAKQVAVIRIVGALSNSLSGIVATSGHVFVSDASRDTVMAIDTRANRVEAEIRIPIPGLESLVGVLPAGLAYDDQTGYLLVAEAGINAVALLDPKSGKVVAQLAAAWRPTRVIVDRGIIYVINEKGQGKGPDEGGNLGFAGSVSIYPMPRPDALARATKFVLLANGFEPRSEAPPPVPQAIRHVVLVLKGNRGFDEVLGDVTKVSNSLVVGAPPLARFGQDGYVDGHGQRLSLHHVSVTPNHHAIATEWAFSDNFYLDADTGPGGREWMAAFGHLLRHRISFYRFGEGFDPQMADTDRARRFIHEIDEEFGSANTDLPQFILVQLPNDRLATARPKAGYPYDESYVADNDEALGRILEYLSGTRWWGRMAVFVTESGADGGIDHIDRDRTLLLSAGPWARKNYVSHINASFPSLFKTIFRLLGVPPMNLFDASAADLSDCFAPAADRASYHAIPVDPRVYNPRSQ